jgi:hypothetical protein
MSSIGSYDACFNAAIEDHFLSPRIDTNSLEFWHVDGHPPHIGQIQAKDATERIILFLAGAQSGKTAAGARWLVREIVKTATDNEANDYLLCGPTIELLKKKAIPELDRLLKPYAVFNQTDRVWKFTEEGARKLVGFPCEIKVFVGYATKPDSLESATYKGCWADEAGQSDFKHESYEAVMRRLSIHQGRLFITTTPYNFGWLKRVIYDKRHDPDKCLINFESRQNPSFSEEEWERAKAEYGENSWKFDLFYRGLFTKPAGMVYDCYDAENEVDAFKIPAGWPLWLGVDFGTINTAAVLLAQELSQGQWGDRWGDPTGVFYVVATYHAGETRTARDHVKEIKKLAEAIYEGPPPMPKAYGGSHQESGWRESWALAGIPVGEPPMIGVISQVQSVWTAFKNRKLKVFRELGKFIQEVEDFAYEVDDVTGLVTDKFDGEAAFHRLAGLRYVVSRCMKTQEKQNAGSIRIGMKSK